MKSGQVNNVFILLIILAFLRRWGKHIESSTKSLRGVCPLIPSKWTVQALLKVGNKKIPGVNNSTNIARTMFSFSMTNWLYKRELSLWAHTISVIILSHLTARLRPAEPEICCEIFHYTFCHILFPCCSMNQPYWLLSVFGFTVSCS